MPRRRGFRIQKAERVVDNISVSIGKSVPRRGNAVSRWLGGAVLRALGWRIEGVIPDAPKMVVIGAPHTSNMDGVLALAALTALGVRASILGKDTLFWWPLGPVLQWFGIIPIDRRNPNGVVGKCVEAIGRSEAMLLLIAPEGTRKAAAEWKRGFWMIASGAGIPILPASLDGRAKRIVIGDLVIAQDYDSDLAHAMKFYRDNAGPLRPERASAPICAALGLDWRGDNAR
jgi:1-acyl-sn-glycerol-3-phosphate acyltransferase